MTSSAPISRLAVAVREARFARGWSKEEAARRAGISSITWKRVEDDQPVHENKLAAVSRVLEWEPGLAYRLKSEVFDPAEGRTVITNSALDQALAALEAARQQLEALKKDT